jgi:homoserine dehydrogenase
MEPADMIASLPRIGIPVLVEALPTNLVDGQPALELLASALAGGTRVVTVDKGPLVFGFEELTNAARAGRSRFAYSGTTGVSAPNQVAGERFVEIEGVLNGTTNFILTEMQESGARFELALERARSRGIAEPDPSLDIAGWDTACKILILAKTLMGAEAGLADVSPMGIGRETELLVEEARARGRVVRLIGRARVYEGKVRVAVAPELVAAESPFHSVTGTSKAAVFTTETKRAVVVHGRSGRDAIAQTILDDLIKLFS